MHGDLVALGTQIREIQLFALANERTRHSCSRCGMHSLTVNRSSSTRRRCYDETTTAKEGGGWDCFASQLVSLALSAGSYCALVHASRCTNRPSLSRPFLTFTHSQASPVSFFLVPFLSLLAAALRVVGFVFVFVSLGSCSFSFFFLCAVESIIFLFGTGWYDAPRDERNGFFFSCMLYTLKVESSHYNNNNNINNTTIATIE